MRIDKDGNELPFTEYFFKEVKKGKKCKLHKKFERLYRAMMERGCDKKFKETHASYKDVNVSIEFQNKNTFVIWCFNNYVDGWELDKDLLSEPDNKIYSENTCVFIPKQLNIFLNSYKYTQGVKYNRKYKNYTAKIMFEGKNYYLGTFNTKAEALKARYDKRQEFVTIWKTRMKGKLPLYAIERIR